MTIGKYKQLRCASVNQCDKTLSSRTVNNHFLKTLFHVRSFIVFNIVVLEINIINLRIES